MVSPATSKRENRSSAFPKEAEEAGITTSAISTSQALCYNLIKPHLGLNGLTPAEAAGPEALSAGNRWLGLIQASQSVVQVSVEDGVSELTSWLRGLTFRRGPTAVTWPPYVLRLGNLTCRDIAPRIRGQSGS